MKGIPVHSLYYQPPNTWFGDCMPVFAQGKFHLYHQRDTRNPGPFGEPFGWALVTTNDFVTFTDHGESLERGTDDDQDQFIFAGSVFEANGSFYAMYTGYNRDYPAQGKASQVLMLAESDDLLTWRKSDQKLVPPQPGYDPDDWRDPFVLWDEEQHNYLMILGARKAGDEILTGSTVAFRSTDLRQWDFHGDFWAPGLYSMHEMPDLFKMGDWWYHIVTEYSDKHKMVYRMAKSLDGPWIAPSDDAFDGSAYYAGRTFELNGQRILFGWVGTKEKCDDRSNFEWGGTFVAHEVYQREDGTLGVRIPDTVWNAFNERENVGNVTIDGTGARQEAVLALGCGDLFSFEADITFSEGTRSFGLRVNENEDTALGYQFIFPVAENRYVFEGSPNFPWFNVMNIGLERPIKLEAGRNYHLQLIVDDTIGTLYVDGVALNVRMYERPGESLSIFATDGVVEVRNVSIARGLKEV